VQGDLVFGLADVRSGQGGIAVFVRDRLAFGADLLRRTGTGCCTSSVTAYVRSRARPTSRRSVPDVDAFLRMRSSEGVMASSPLTPVSAERGLSVVSLVPVWTQPPSPGWWACCQAPFQAMP
jgi:hypothetical protein